MSEYKGTVNAKIVDARFAVSGKISKVAKLTGDPVKKWDLIAAMDRKILQTELDAQLSDFEKERADFEIIAQKYPNPTDTIEKYLKSAKNAQLNSSVKAVELAKARLDQADLFSPVDGIIMDDSGITVGQYVTPAGSAIRIIDMGSFYFEFEIEQKDIPEFKDTRKCKINIPGVSGEIEGETGKAASDGKKFSVRVSLPASDELLIGMEGTVSF